MLFEPEDDERAIRWYARVVILYLLASLVGLLFMIATGISWVARAQDCVEGTYGCGHAQNHEMYENWTVPGNVGSSCCHGQHENDDEVRNPEPDPAA